MKEMATRAGYHLQLDSEIPASIRGEIRRHVINNSPSTLLNITSRAAENWNCIDETLDLELDSRSKKSFGEVAFFRFLRAIFEFAEPTRVVMIYVEGAEVGWFPLTKRACSLDEFLFALYENRDRLGHDVAGVYEITRQLSDEMTVMLHTQCS